jgi:hypothetical protein
MEIKMNNHGFRRVFFDILRDTNTAKYSMTKFAALVGLILFSATVIMSLIIVWQTKKIDYVLIVELIGFILTLLGFKNNFGLKTTPNSQTIITGGNDNNGQMGDGAKQMLNEVKPDNVDDSLKG